MRNLIYKVQDAFAPLRNGSTGAKVIYWFYRVSIIMVPVLIVAVIAGLIYCAVNGIKIALPF